MIHSIFIAFLVVACGAFSVSFLSISFEVSFALGLAAWTAAGVGWRRVRWMLIFLAIALFFFGHGLMQGSPARVLSAKWNAATAEVPWVALEAVVERPMGAGWILSDLKPVGSNQVLPGKIMLRGSRDLPHLSIGDRVALDGSWVSVDGKRNPGGFDFRSFLTSNGVFASLKADHVRILDQKSWADRPILLDLRRKLLDRMDRVFDPATAAFSGALFANARATLEPSFKQALIDTSTMHIFAISGLHIALVVGWLMAVTMFLARFPVLRVSVVSVLVCAYCALVGSQPPVLRATIMACVYLAAFVLFRRPQSWNALGLAGLIIMMINPEELFGAGFQLSFAAVAGLMWISPQFFDLEAWRVSKTGGWLERTRFYFLGLAVVCVLAWVITMPLTVHYFHHVHLLSPVVNFIVLPITFVMLGLLMVWSLLFALPDAWLGVLTVPVRWCSDLSTWFIETFHRMDAVSWNAAPWHAVTLIFFFAVLAGIAALKSRMRYPMRLLAVVLLTLNCLVLNQTLVSAGTPPFTMTVLDVGQGDALLFEFAGGKTLLVDTGKKESGRRVIAPYLRELGKQNIDAIVISHPQFDHCGALEELLEDFEVGAVFDNGDRNLSDFYQNMLKTLEAKQVPHVTLQAGDRLLGFKDVEIQALHPRASLGDEADLNNASLTLLVRYAGRQVLLTGDLEDEGLQELLMNSSLDRADVLKTPHHGARLSENGLRLLRKTKPRVALISAGRENRYGHPHPETTNMLETLVPQTYRTDRDGAVTVRINKKGEILTEKMV